LYPFAVRVTFGAVRGLSPQEPQYFRCHCMAWVQDRRHAKRFRSSLRSDRDDVHFNESAVFVVDKMDVLRVMVYEVAMVGWIDIPMADFFGKSGIWPAVIEGGVGYDTATSPTSPKKPFATTTTTTTVRPITPPVNSSGGGGGCGSAAIGDDIELLPRQNVLTTSQPASNNPFIDGDAAPIGDTLPPENHLLIDKWFSLTGQDVAGEIHLRLERVPMPEAPRSKRGFCCVM
jgi:hypothetical protein